MDAIRELPEMRLMAVQFDQPKLLMTGPTPATRFWGFWAEAEVLKQARHRVMVTLIAASVLRILMILLGCSRKRAGTLVRNGFVRIVRRAIAYRITKFQSA